MLGVSPIWVVVIAGTITMAFSAVGGFKGVVYTDFLLFFVAMGGAIAAAVYLVNIPKVGGVANLLTHENVAEKISILPDFNDKEALITILIIALAVQWCSSWYPGAEPAGGDYIAQRMLAAKDENHAIGATFFFNIMHLRPWPWILVALASLVVFRSGEYSAGVPQYRAGQTGAGSGLLCHVDQTALGTAWHRDGLTVRSIYLHDLYPPQLGSSYIVNDFYKQQINKNATDKQQVMVGRISTVLLMVVSTALALALTNAWSVITAMFASGIISILFNFTNLGNYFFDSKNMLTGEIIPGLMPGWAKFPMIVLVTTILCLLIYSCTFATGYWIYGHYAWALPMTSIAIVFAVLLIRLWKSIRVNVL